MSNNKPQIASSGMWNGLHPGMSIAAKGMVIAFVVFTILNVDFANGIYKAVRGWIETTLNWYYITAVLVMVFVCFYLMFSRHGSVKLGADDSEPEFSYFSWFAMLFSAGVGIGLLFWSIAEPIYHFQGNPFIDQAGVEAQSAAAAVIAMRVTYFHWGFHGWAVYVMVALCLAYFGFRKGLPLTMRSALFPIIGNRIYGPIGHAVDLLAVFGTVFGVATSLGLGVSQMGAGLSHLSDGAIVNNVWTQVSLIAIISVIATLSAVSGVGKGIRIISEWNIWLSVILILAFLIVGPTKYLLGFYISTLGDYLWNVVPMGFFVGNTPEDAKWQGGWTIFYWGWWISWAPFVGMFIARISRGRTIREFMLGAMFVPTSIAFLWLAIFGGSALHLELFSDTGRVIGGAQNALTNLFQPQPGVIDAVNADLSQALYRTIELMNFGWLAWPVAALATFLIATWFITSSDSGTLVITTMLSMGDDNPPKRFRIVWGMGEGVVAAALLIAGGLGALQTASIAAALPVSVIMLMMAYGVVKSLSEDSSASPLASGSSAASQAAEAETKTAS